jgi:hypothetical protein
MNGAFFNQQIQDDFRYSMLHFHPFPRDLRRVLEFIWCKIGLICSLQKDLLFFFTDSNTLVWRNFFHSSPCSFTIAAEENLKDFFGNFNCNLKLLDFFLLKSVCAMDAIFQKLHFTELIYIGWSRWVFIYNKKINLSLNYESLVLAE